MAEATTIHVSRILGSVIWFNSIYRTKEGYRNGINETKSESSIEVIIW
jgi:hypothetical protein